MDCVSHHRSLTSVGDGAAVVQAVPRAGVVSSTKPAVHDGHESVRPVAAFDWTSVTGNASASGPNW